MAGVRDVEPLENVAWFAARRLVESFHRGRRPDWDWFEPRMTYANAVLPHALFLASRRWPAEPFGEIAEASFAFLDRETTAENLFRPIGCNGWYSHGLDKAPYDQQPVEAATMADAALAALTLLGEEKYLTTFHRAHAWFRGENSLKLPLVDVRRGACCDGLQPSGVNRNQGAESTLAYLWMEMLTVEFQQSQRACPRTAVASA
jgi:hypothetical protein